MNTAAGVKGQTAEMSKIWIFIKVKYLHHLSFTLLIMEVFAVVTVVVESVVVVVLVVVLFVCRRREYLYRSGGGICGVV